jgi:hypothetical protein
MVYAMITETISILFPSTASFKDVVNKPDAIQMTNNKTANKNMLMLIIKRSDARYSFFDFKRVNFSDKIPSTKAMIKN